MAKKDCTDGECPMKDHPAFRELREVQAWLADGDLEQLEFASMALDGFPHGRDNWHGTHWIVHAVSGGCLKAVRWMIERGVDLQLDDHCGYPPLIACIEGDGREKHQILAALIDAGADIDQRGINGWTPLHMAAMGDDEAAMQMLLLAGADRSIRTGVDDDATPEQEARKLGHVESADFIARFAP